MRIYRTFFARKLREALERSKLNQRMLADKLDVEPPSVSRWINGEDFPDEERLPKITKALGVPKDYFEIDDQEVRKLGVNYASELLAAFAELPPDMQRWVFALVTRDPDAYYSLPDVASEALQNGLKLRRSKS